MHAHFGNMNNSGTRKYFFIGSPGVWLRGQGKPNPSKGNLESLKILQNRKKVFLWQTGPFIPKLSGSLKKRADIGYRRCCFIRTITWVSDWWSPALATAELSFPRSWSEGVLRLDEAEVLGEKGWGRWYSPPSKQAQRVQRKSNKSATSSFHYCEPFNPWSRTQK